MTKKLKILGPYTPDHKGPFCTRDGRPVDLRIRDGRKYYPIAGYVGDDETISEWTASGNYRDDMNTAIDLMNAEEIPKARELLIYEYLREGGLVGITTPHATECEAQRALCELIG